jgi:DNA-binding NarL/FixJ family response regulator
MKSLSTYHERSRQKILEMYETGAAPELTYQDEVRRVLLADDDVGFRTAFKRILETLRGLHVRQASNGEEAVRFARLYRPDLVLMDLSMPQVDGLQAVRMIKNAWPAVRIIVCSAHVGPLYRRAATLNGADGFLSKSECFAELDWIERMAWDGAGLAKIESN